MQARHAVLQALADVVLHGRAAGLPDVHEEDAGEGLSVRVRALLARVVGGGGREHERVRGAHRFANHDHSRSPALQLTRRGKGAPRGGNMGDCNVTLGLVLGLGREMRSLPALNQMSLREYSSHNALTPDSH